MLSYLNPTPTSYTFELNMDRARLIYGLMMKMDMDIDNMILLQITKITQSSMSRFGFPALIIALYDAKGINSDTLRYESLSPVINLAYIKKNCWNPVDSSIVFLGPRRVWAKATQDAPPPVIPPLATSSFVAQPSSQSQLLFPML